VPEITCVVNAHSESHLIIPTLKSVKRAQRYAKECGLETQLFVVLDNGKDDTDVVIEQMLDDNCKYAKINLGDLALSRNYAVAESDSEYITFIDGDDLWCKTWLVDSYIAANRVTEDVVLHPEYNIYFGGSSVHAFRHIDAESQQFEADYFFSQNYWTALTFARRNIYARYPYKKNTILDGFGYEDWTWNYETHQMGVKHNTVKNNAHVIRRGKEQPSLLDLTNAGNAIPRILDIYRKNTGTSVNSLAA